MLKYKDILAAILINVFFLALCLFFGKLQYGALDDFFMAGVLTGIHGDAYNPHLYFVNALYGYALLPFYHLFPKIGWYYIFEMFGLFVSFVLISYVLIKRVGFNLGVCAAIVLLSMLCSDFYLVVQFTQCAALYSAAGFAALLYSLNEGKYKVLLLACVMIIWGSWMRWEAFLMGLPFCCIVALFSIDDFKKHVVRTLVTVLTLVTLVLGTHYFDNKLYETEEYRPYKEIQGPRAAFGDATNYNMQAVYEDMEELGKSGLDYVMLTNWEFYDTENFRVDSLREILKYVDCHRNKTSAISISSNMIGTLQNSSGRPIFWLFVIFCLLLFLSNPPKSGYAWVSLAVVLCLLAYLLALNRLVYRVETGIWMYASVLAIPLLREKIQISNKIAFVLISILLVANVVVFFQSGALVRDPTRGNVGELGDSKDSTDYIQVFDYIEKNPDKMFLVKMNTYMKFARHKNPPYLSEPAGSFKRTISFGYWTPYLPEITETLKDFGITNPIKDVVHENVISVDVGDLRGYLHRHYYDSVRVDTVNRIGDVVFYKYSIVGKQ
jgi:hypothetical protein